MQASSLGRASPGLPGSMGLTQSKEKGFLASGLRV